MKGMSCLTCPRLALELKYSRRHRGFPRPAFDLAAAIASKQTAHIELIDAGIKQRNRV